MQAMDWAALKSRGSASICEGVVPSEIACTRVIDWIQAGVRIAWTATKAARSSRSLRARRISTNPKTTAVNTVRAVAMFATVERSTAAICSNGSFDVTQIWSLRNMVNDTKSRRARGNPAARIVIPRRRVDSVYNNHVINHTQIAHICVVNAHARAGFDRCLDDVPCLVHNVTTPVENITARIIGTILPNNERFARLKARSRAFFSRRFDDRSGYLYWFRRSCSLFIIR